MFTNVVIIGASGQLGLAVRRRLEAAGRRPLAPAPAELDLTAPDVIERLSRLRPTAVVNTAAWTDVRGAEDAANRETVWQVNCHGPGRVAAWCARAGVPFVQVSTDYVFDGSQREPYREDDAVRPLQAYGCSKLDGERAVAAACPRALIARTSTVYGRRPEGPPHYVDAILAQARRGKRIEVVRLPVSSPSYTPDIADGLVRLMECDAAGIVHVVNDGAASRLELAHAAVRLAGLDCEVAERAAPVDDLARPDYSVLDTARYRSCTGVAMRSWEDALAEYVREVST